MSNLGCVNLGPKFLDSINQVAGSLYTNNTFEDHYNLDSYYAVI